MPDGVESIAAVDITTGYGYGLVMGMCIQPRGCIKAILQVMDIKGKPCKLLLRLAGL
jgi:hypothetical protein